MEAKAAKTYLVPLVIGIFLVVFVSTVSAQMKVSPGLSTADFSSFLQQNNWEPGSEGKEIVLLVPSEGCKGCSRELLRLYKDLNRYHTSIRFILYPVTRGSFRTMSGELEGFNYCQDLSRSADVHHLVYSWPVVGFFSQGKLDRLEFVKTAQVPELKENITEFLAG